MAKLPVPQGPTDEPKELEKPSSPLAALDSQDLLRGRREIRITHGNEVYRLLVTRNNKLILQK